MKKTTLSNGIFCVMVIGLAVSGCGSGVEKWRKQILAQDSPDLRRESVQELMSQRKGKSDEAVRLFAMLAESDSDATVRSAAVTALGESERESAVAPLARVLANDDDGQVRRDAAVALGKVNGAEAVRTLLDRLREDENNEVRAACARTLGEYPHPGVCQALVAAQLSGEFSVEFEARRSLKKLTGKSFETGRAWQDWLDETGEPFAVSEGN